MKTNYLFPTFFILAIFIGIFLLYTNNQVRIESDFLKADLAYRTNVLAKNLIQNFSDREYSPKYIEQSFSRLISSEKLLQLNYFDPNGLLLSNKVNASSSLSESEPVIVSKFIQSSKTSDIQDYKSFSRFIYRVENEKKETQGYLVVDQDSRYISDYINRFWVDSLSKFSFIFFGMILVLVFIFYFFVLRPSQVAVQVIKNIRKSIDTSIDIPDSFLPFSGALRDEIYLTIKSFVAARHTAREEADLRQKIIDSPWTENRLGQFFRQRLADRCMVVVSNREPYAHVQSPKGVEVKKSSHGLFIALDSVLKSTGGIWVAHGGGDKDREFVDSEDKIMVPIEEPKYKLRRVWLSDEEVSGHYVGFSNEALFPLCLMTHNRPIFREGDWQAYKNVNQKFADAVLEEIEGKDKPIIFIQDLHLAILPTLIKNKRPDAEVILFWHHPWPSAEQFSICPWSKEILSSLLNADLLGFHIQLFCNNFLETIKKELEAKIDIETMSVTYQGKNTLVRAFPISIPFVHPKSRVKDYKNFDLKSLLNKEVIGQKIILGVDRLDYTKGLIERLRGVEVFFEKYPEHLKKAVFVQVAAPSREKVKKYREYANEVLQEVERINRKLQTSSWQPIIFLHKQFDHNVLDPLYALSDVCLVTSLHDGMNLVAKEYIVQQEDKGVLVLSKFAGASKELSSAIIVNPYSTSEIAEAINTAFTMSIEDKKSRIEFMRNKVSQYNVYRWIADILNTLLNKY